MTEAITMAPRTALGRLWNRGASTSRVMMISTAVTIDESCVRSPASSAVAVDERLASTVKPWNRPALMLAAPRAISSWSGLIS